MLNFKIVAHLCAPTCPSLPESGWARTHPFPMVPVSREIFTLVKKLPLAKGGDFFMHAEHEKISPRRFIQDHCL